jgi:hypothetical protein
MDALAEDNDSALAVTIIRGVLSSGSFNALTNCAQRGGGRQRQRWEEMDDISYDERISNTSTTINS